MPNFEKFEYEPKSKAEFVRDMNEILLRLDYILSTVGHGTVEEKSLMDAMRWRCNYAIKAGYVSESYVDELSGKTLKFEDNSLEYFEKAYWVCRNAVEKDSVDWLNA